MPKKLYFKVFNRLNYLSRIQMNIKILFLLLFLMYLTSLIFIRKDNSNTVWNIRWFYNYKKIINFIF